MAVSKEHKMEGIMASKIKSVSIVSQQGVNSYRVGNEYNGLALHHIVDASIEHPDSFHSIHIGLTFNNERVFMSIHAPVDVEYERG